MRLLFLASSPPSFPSLQERFVLEQGTETPYLNSSGRAHAFLFIYLFNVILKY